MREGGRIIGPVSGHQCDFNVEYAKTTAAGTFSDRDIVETAPNEFVMRPSLDWGGFYASVSISVNESDANQSPEAIYNLLEAKINNATQTLEDNIGVGLFSKGTDSKGIVGLRQAICDSSNASGEGVSTTYANINRSSYSWWNSNVDKDTTNYTASNLSSGGSTLAYTLPYLLRKMWGNCTQGNMRGRRPTMHVTSQAFYDIYEEWALSKGTIEMSNPAKGIYTTGIGRASADLQDLGFGEFTYKGAPILVDSHCPTNYWYMLNEDRLKFIATGSKDLRETGWKEPENQIKTMVKQIFLRGQLVLTEPRSCGVIIGDSTTLNY